MDLHKNTLHIMRGLPGSGKSTAAIKLLSSLAKEPGISGMIISTDQFFKLPSGEYKFEPSLIGHAHDWCKSRVRQHMEKRTSLIILDNTNIQYWEFAPYTLMAKDMNYRVQTQVVGFGLRPRESDPNQDMMEHYFERGIHNVPLEIIQDMAERWEE